MSLPVKRDYEAELSSLFPEMAFPGWNKDIIEQVYESIVDTDISKYAYIGYDPTKCRSEFMRLGQLRHQKAAFAELTKKYKCTLEDIAKIFRAVRDPKIDTKGQAEQLAGEMKNDFQTFCIRRTLDDVKNLLAFLFQHSPNIHKVLSNSNSLKKETYDELNTLVQDYKIQKNKGSSNNPQASEVITMVRLQATFPDIASNILSRFSSAHTTVSPNDVPELPPCYKFSHGPSIIPNTSRRAELLELWEKWSKLQDAQINNKMENREKNYEDRKNYREVIRNSNFVPETFKKFIYEKSVLLMKLDPFFKSQSAVHINPYDEKI